MTAIAALPDGLAWASPPAGTTEWSGWDPDGTLEPYADLSDLSDHGWNEVAVHRSRLHDRGRGPGRLIGRDVDQRLRRRAREDEHMKTPAIALRVVELARGDLRWLVGRIRSGPPPGFFRIGWVRSLLEWAGTNERQLARPGDPVARLAGSPGELLLHLFGRRRAAHVEVSGSAEVVAAVHRTHFGM